MSHIAYVNGRYLPQSEAAVNVEDRGYQFADGVYEVIAAVGGRLVDAERHYDRLDRSMGELRIEAPCSRRVLHLIARETLRRNFIRDGFVYIQVTRGVAPRNHAFPADAGPALVMTASRHRGPPKAMVEDGVAVITLPDTRWGRVDIKSVGLLPNVPGKQQAVEAGAFEAWLVNADGEVTEGTSTNAWIVTESGELVTHPIDSSILAGITRRAVIDAALEQQIRVVERPFTIDEAYAAREALITSTTSFVLPVTRIDEQAVGDGRPGPVTRALLERYVDHVEGGDAPR